MNIADINSHILFIASHVDRSKMSRRRILKAIALFLMKPFVSEGAGMANLSEGVQNTLRRGGGRRTSGKNSKMVLLLWKTKNRLTTIKCKSCKRPVCKEYSVITGSECRNPHHEGEDSELSLVVLRFCLIALLCFKFFCVYSYSFTLLCFSCVFFCNKVSNTNQFVCILYLRYDI
nr:unnamed protein product [Callosobruchus analis]